MLSFDICSEEFSCCNNWIGLPWEFHLPSIHDKSNMQSVQYIQNCLSSLSRTYLSCLSLTAQQSGNYSSPFSCPPRPEGGWLHARQNIDSLLALQLVSPTLYQFRHSHVLLLHSSFSRSFITFSFRQIRLPVLSLRSTINTLPPHTGCAAHCLS